MNNHPNFVPAVQNLQRYLRRLSYGEESIPAPPIDGVLETQTIEALREFQRLRGLPITGIADLETWELLYSDYRAALSYNAPPRQISVFPLDPQGYVLLPNATGFAVTALQYMLRELHHSYFALLDVSETGVYDEQTQAAVRKFQELNRLPVSGNTDLLTWNAVADQYNTYFWNTFDE